jgi:hypothetical protein
VAGSMARGCRPPTANLTPGSFLARWPIASAQLVAKRVGRSFGEGQDSAYRRVTPARDLPALEAGLRRRQNRLVAKRSPSCSCEHETTFDDAASRCCRVRTGKSRLRLAGVRTAAGLGRPLSAFAIGPSGLLGRRVWARDSRCGARRMDTLGAAAAVHRQTFHLLSGSQNSPTLG